MTRPCTLSLALSATLLGVAGPATRAEAKLAPTVSKSIVGCPEPCFKGILPDPFITTVTYAITISNPNPERVGLYVDLVDDIPPEAIAFRVVDKGNLQACPGFSGATCENVDAPGGANGTGQVVLKTIGLSPAGLPFSSRRILVEVDFACPPLTAFDVRSNEATVTTPFDPGLCAPCLTNAVVFTAKCLPPPDYTIKKTVDPVEWTKGESKVFNYTITVHNPSATRTLPGQFLELDDTLPFICAPLGCNALFDRPNTCFPLTVTITPPSPLILVDTSKCDSGQPKLKFSRFPDLPPGQDIKIQFPITILEGLGDGQLYCNKVEPTLAGVPGPTAKGCTLIHYPEPLYFTQSFKSVAPFSVSRGGAINWELFVAHTGTVVAPKVIIQDDFDACLDLTGFVPSRDVKVTPGPGTATLSGRTLFVSLGDMNPGDTHTISVDLKAGTLFGPCCNLAWISCTGIPAPGRSFGLAPGGGITPTCFEVNPIPPPSFVESTKVAIPAEAPVGSPVIYSLTIHNSGVGSANNTTVFDGIASCLDDSGFVPATDVTIDSGTVTATYAGRALTIVIPGVMAPNETRVVTVRGFKAKTETASCCNQAYVSSDEVASPGSPTGTTPGGSDPTCIPITPAIPPGCDLLRKVVTSPVKTGPWVYTNECAPDDVRLTGPPFRLGVFSGDSIEPLGGGAGWSLTVYQLDCRCADLIEIEKDPATGALTLSY